MLAFGGYQDGTPGTFTAETYTCIARSVRFSTSVNSVDVSALCDTQNKAQVTKANGSVEVEFLVDSVVGPIFFGKDGMPPYW